ncbi:MAG: FAD-binding oxidoreductase [Chloroflexales bacterium]|nr:FAD-binding oxidoreductase [Chloroflexales bacterium]
MYDIIIIGTGPIGAGAARHASAAGAKIAVIGPNEAPRDTHTVWSSHYDAARLTHRSARNVQLAQYALEAIANYRIIEAQSGISFYTPCGTLSLSHDLGGFSYTSQRTAIEQALGFTYVDYPPHQITHAFPMLSADLGYHGVYDGPPSGYIAPRAMVAAQLTCAQQQGATVVRDIVTQLTPHSDFVTVTTSDGATLRATRVILAAGAYSGLCGLLPTPVPHSIKSETVTLGRVSATTAARMATMPSMMVDCVSDVISDAYLTPPLQYPDGEWYFKLGSNSIHDLFFDTLPGLQQWIKNSDMKATQLAQIALLNQLFAGVEWLEFTSLPCVITRTPDGVPTISNVHPRVTAVVGCNGSLAKSGDTIGRVAFELAHAS